MLLFYVPHINALVVFDGLQGVELIHGNEVLLQNVLGFITGPSRVGVNVITYNIDRILILILIIGYMLVSHAGFVIDTAWIRSSFVVIWDIFLIKARFNRL